MFLYYYYIENDYKRLKLVNVAYNRGLTFKNAPPLNFILSMKRKLYKSAVCI